MNLYCTADLIGTPTGGGTVTHYELEAFKTLGKYEQFSRKELEGGNDPWGWDEVAARKLTTTLFLEPFGLAHFYSGSFSKTVEVLKHNNVKVCYTIAAHDREVSRREHEKFGIDFASSYPHLVQPVLWQRYIECYRQADVIVCPGIVPAQTVRRYGPEFEKKRIEVIPHGCSLPQCHECQGGREVPGAGGRAHWKEDCGRCGGTGVEPIAPLPNRFTVGYLGAYGADKGVVYLMEAWKKLGYRDATLVLAGKESTQPWLRQLWEVAGGGNVCFVGWQEDLSAFYNSLSLYVQPSATEGFGIEVAEALSHARPVICSNGAGAVDCMQGLGWGTPIQACDSNLLAEVIDWHKKNPPTVNGLAELRKRAETLTWDKIRARYIKLWKELLCG